MGSVSVPSCRSCMFVSCVHPVAVLNAAFCMTFSMLMLVEDARSGHMEEAYSKAGLLWVRCHGYYSVVYLRYRLLVCSVWSRMNRVQVVLSGFIVCPGNNFI